jgi:Leucine-rich repeat (LRR) protein
MSALTQLTSLDVSGVSNQHAYSNNFSGELPLWMLRKNLTGQMELRLHQPTWQTQIYDSNRFELPHNIGSLNGTVIKEELDLSNQGLGGHLPVSFGNLTLLRRLNLASNLASNGFNGSIGLLSTLTQLTNLSLSFNGFSGSIGPLAMLTGLEVLGLGCVGSTAEEPAGGYSNGCGMLTGSFDMLSRLSQLRSLDLSAQRVGGTLEGLSHLTKLTSLVLSYNQATSGTIPTSFVQLKQLTTLQLQCCRLTGAVPALAMLASPSYPGQCELTEHGTSSNCFPYGSEQNNHFSCPLPTGAAENCAGWCS